MSNTPAPDWIKVTDEAGIPIYSGTHDYCARFLRYRTKCVASDFNSAEWWSAKNKIDHGPGVLIFEGGDIYGRRA